MTLRLSAFGALALVLTATFGAAAQEEEKVVRIYNWSDYIDPSVLADFTKETGIQVVYDVYDSNDLLETKILAGSTGYDIVVPSADYLARQIGAGVYKKLDKSKLTNIGNMWDFVTNNVAKFDPDNTYSINYMWGTVGIGYNVDKVKAALGDVPVDTWSIVFDPKNAEKLSKCGINLLDSSTDIMPAALKYLNLDPNSHDADDIKKAQELLLKIRPYVTKFHSSEYINGLANGDICLAVGYSGDVLQARSRAKEAGQGVTIAYSIPKEGAKMWFDEMAMPVDAPHPNNALTFLNFMMRPDMIARSSDFVSYANGNKASQSLISKEVLNDPGIYPDEATLKNLYIGLPYDQKTMRLMTRAFTTVKTGE